MKNCEKFAAVQKQECWKCKVMPQIRKSAENVPSAIGTGLVAFSYDGPRLGVEGK